MADRPAGWFPDFDEDAEVPNIWRPALETSAGHTAFLNVWFESPEACKWWIGEFVTGGGASPAPRDDTGPSVTSSKAAPKDDGVRESRAVAASQAECDVAEVLHTHPAVTWADALDLAASVLALPIVQRLIDQGKAEAEARGRAEAVRELHLRAMRADR